VFIHYEEGGGGIFENGELNSRGQDYRVVKGGHFRCVLRCASIRKTTACYVCRDTTCHYSLFS